MMKTMISVVAIAGLFSMAACNTSALKEKEAALRIQQHTIDSMNIELARKNVIDSMNEVAGTRYMIPPMESVSPVSPAVVRYVQPARRTSSRSRRSSGYSAPVAQSQPVVYQEAPVAQRKKGWSAKAKGAVIGAGTGAIAGAVINGRNRAAGAVIGTILGAGAGTGIGAILDKKNGR